MKQRKSVGNPVSPGGVDEPPTSAGGASAAAAAGAGRSQPPTPTSPLFDIEGSLGRGNSARHQATGGSSSLAGPHDRIECALAPGSNVDFPTITEVCELLSARPDDVPGAVEILLQSLGARSLPRRRLKALTILNELVYDAHVARHVWQYPGALQLFQPLQACRGTGLGREADEQIRMFATELERRVFVEVQQPKKTAPPTSPLGGGAPAGRSRPAGGPAAPPAEVFRDDRSKASPGHTTYTGSVQQPLGGSSEGDTLWD